MGRPCEAAVGVRSMDVLGDSGDVLTFQWSLNFSQASASTEQRTAGAGSPRARQQPICSFYLDTRGARATHPTAH